MKRVIVFFFLFLFAIASTFNAFSYTIDGIDNGYEWDSATVYKIFDGESNSGVNFGVLKYKFDYETSAVMFCFMFSDPEFTQDNPNAGILLTVEGYDFEFDASDISSAQNIEPYSFEGAIYLDVNNGATAEIRVGVKSGLPKSLDCCVRFIDSHGYYSNLYSFTVVNDNYQETENVIIYPSDDNNTQKTSKKRTTTEKRTSTTKKRTTTIEKTSSAAVTERTRYSYTQQTYKPKTKKETTVLTEIKTTEENKPTIIYQEKEIYISHVYIVQTESTLPLNTTSASEVTTVQSTDYITESSSSENKITLSKGTKYKKILSVAGLTSFLIVAGFGLYSAKKTSEKSSENKSTEE